MKEKQQRIKENQLKGKQEKKKTNQWERQETIIIKWINDERKKTQISIQ